MADMAQRTHARRQLDLCRMLSSRIRDKLHSECCQQYNCASFQPPYLPTKLLHSFELKHARQTNVHCMLSQVRNSTMRRHRPLIVEIALSNGHRPAQPSQADPLLEEHVIATLRIPTRLPSTTAAPLSAHKFSLPGARHMDTTLTATHSEARRQQKLQRQQRPS